MRGDGHVEVILLRVLAAVVLCAACTGERCEDAPLANAHIEAPGSATAGIPLDVLVRDASEGCVAENLSCRTALHEVDNTVLLVVTGSSCAPRPERPCAPAEVTCTVAPLRAGDYQISLNGAPPAHPFHVR